MSKMSPSLKAKHKRHACLPPTHPSKDWSGVATKPVPEVAQPHAQKECRMHHELATAGSELSLPKVV